MNIWGLALKMFGWRVRITAPVRDKCVICVAPHTTNWDFIVGLAAYHSLGRKANFLMKKFWFFFPLKYILNALGGIPVDRRPAGSKGRGHSLTASIIDKFKHSTYLNLAVTPEGTRSANAKWKTGFLTIAKGAGVPVLLAGLDYKTKTIVFDSFIFPGPDTEEDLREVKNFYADKKDWAKYPDKFLTDEQP